MNLQHWTPLFHLFLLASVAGGIWLIRWPLIEAIRTLFTDEERFEDVDLLAARDRKEQP